MAGVRTSVGAVVIGRNEGERLIRCLASLDGLAPVVYVDSGSTDGSQAAARAAGAEVVDLDTDTPFTAARARNAGLARLTEIAGDTEFVQFLDGDTELRQGWVETARTALSADARLAVVCGRRRERHPEASVYNRLIDREWDTPVGEAQACGGDAMMRLDALTEIGGFNPTLIAGEEPEMCLRLTRAGWLIRRIDAEMTWHDADLTYLSQWWRRARRAGHAYAEGAAMHGRGPERFRLREMRGILAWGLILPIGTLACLFATPWAALLLLAWPAQVLRLRLKGHPVAEALSHTFIKLPQAQGMLDFLLGRLRGRGRGLIEYK